MTDSNLLSKEQEFFRKKRKELLPNNRGKWVLIYKEEILGIFESFKNGLEQGYLQCGDEPFLLREITRVDKPIIFHHGVL
ncbi:MAG: hypothetical protein P9X24_12865 [Candidatus Hatepunaea meridiana]|nr:hypothetical protein [Candidatus Hatepunaea meridiana]